MHPPVISPKGIAYAFLGPYVRPVCIIYLREVSVIKAMVPVNLSIYFPQTKEGREELAKRSAQIHAASVIQRLKRLNCPISQKLALLDSVINTARARIQNNIS